MFMKAAKRLTALMAEQGIITQDRQTVCCWGLSHILDTLFNSAVFAVIGIAAGMLPETVIFTAAYMFLRVYAGGFHASTPFRCFVLSVMICILSLMVITAAESHMEISLICSMAAAAVIALLLPVEDMHKPLSVTDRKRYRRKGLLIMAAETALSAVFYRAGFHTMVCAVGTAWHVLALILIAGMAKNAIHNVKAI